MSLPVTGFPSKEPRNSNQETLSSQRHLWTSYGTWISATCLLFAGIFYWLYHSALCVLPLPHGPTLLDGLGGTDVTGGPIVATKQDIQAQNPPTMPSNGNALWYKNEACNWVREYLPIGNGYLGGEYSCGIFTQPSYSNMTSYDSDGIWRCHF